MCCDASGNWSKSRSKKNSLVGGVSVLRNSDSKEGSVMIGSIVSMTYTPENTGGCPSLFELVNVSNDTHSD